jgi:CubicO group peptidase (beta-lactamase class C family)
MTQISGQADPRFKNLKDAFASSFADGLEQGAGVAVMLDGKLVAEFWGGHADVAKTKTWACDTLVNVWSCTKGVLAAAVAIAAGRGLLRYDEPIATYWPEFAAEGKDKITLDLVMSHRAGLNGWTAPLNEETLHDWDKSCALLAAQKPIYEPGTICAYHALTYGHLAGAVLQRVTGQTPGAFIRSEIAERLGADFHVGVPESEDYRCAEMIAGRGVSDWIDNMQKTALPHSTRNPTPRATAPNDRRWRAVEIPGGNGHATAVGLASIYGDMVSGASQLMSKETLALASRMRFKGTDESFNNPACWAAGFALEDISRASPRTIGHGGWGGAMGFGDPEARLGFAYVTNHMLGFDDGIDPRRQRLIDAVYDAL